MGRASALAIILVLFVMPFSHGASRERALTGPAGTTTQGAPLTGPGYESAPAGKAQAPMRPQSGPAEMLGLALAGIGLFLVGVRFVSDNLKKMANRRLRVSLARWTKSRFLGALWGMLCGAVSQSGTSSGFLLAGFVSSRMLPLRNAALILAWSEVGTSLLVFLATAGIKLVILYFLAFSAIAHSFDRRWRYESLLTTCLGLGLLLFGFDLVTSTAVRLTELQWIHHLMGVTVRSLLLLFLLGTALRMATQSSSAVTILSIPLMNSGMLSLPQCIAMVCGTSLGGAIAGLLLSSDLKGVAKQLIWHKAITDTFSGLFFFGLLLQPDRDQVGFRARRKAVVQKLFVVYAVRDFGDPVFVGDEFDLADACGYAAFGKF